MTNIKTPKDAIEFTKEHGAVMADLRFVDMLGTWQHTSVPAHRIDEDAFEDGFGFDGSSIRGFQPIDASDMLIIPDASTVKMDPFTLHPTVVFICDIVDPITREPYPRDPRFVARKAAAYLKQTGIADTCFVGPEPEFFIFDDVRYGSAPRGSFFQIDSEEAAWNSGSDEGPNLGYKIQHKAGYFPVMPTDTLMDLRTEISLILTQLGYEVEVSHHEVATAGQCEIDMRFNDLLGMADQTMWFKYVVKNAARVAGQTATFMPKPMYGDNGSGMHCHLSLWKDGTPLFAGDGFAGMSDMGLHFIGGILAHARALTAFTNPTTNSFRRLVPGYEAPVNLAYSSRNRSAAIRIPTYSQSPAAKRMEARFPDPLANPYLAFSALMMAGLDGVLNKTDPGAPFDKDLYSLSPEELDGVPTLPSSLDESLEALAADHEFLLQGDVFTADLIEEWKSYKENEEINKARLRPTPLEYELYFDA